jgi:meso-butanediol dehydrogenase / (S,S)-butanediol dehydrogenase / diacetyl reductase
MTELAGQTVVITGAGAGIGQALAIGFVGKGAYVVAVGRSAAGLEQTRTLCLGPGSLETHLSDVADSDSLEQLFGRIVAERGGVDLLINNAAVYPRQSLGDTSAQAWAAGVATNLNGVAYGCRAAVRVFPPGRAAVVFNVGTFAHLGPEPASTLYCATKAAVSAFTRALAVELAAAGSTLIVNEWIPGIYRTRMSGNTGEDPALAFERLLVAWQLARQGRGGRVFLAASEVLPQRSLRSRIKSRLLGRRT